MVINEENLRSYLENMDCNDEKIERLFFSLWVLHKMHGGNIELPLEDFKEMGILLLKKYKGRSRGYVEWCLLVSVYLIKEYAYDDGMQLMNRALEKSQEKYYCDSDSVSTITDYVLALFYLAEFYMKNKKNHMLSLLYYSKALETLNNVSKNTSSKMNHYAEWTLDVSKKIDDLINDETLLEQKMVVSVINSRHNYTSSKE